MSLVPFDRKYRRIWMFPRPIRRIPPWKLSQILSLLIQQSESGQWTGNQKMQNAFIGALNSAGIKAGDYLRDPNSGGARTYMSLLEYLGLVFFRSGRIYLTLAGEDLCGGNSLLPILQNMLLRMQYPSTYSLSPNVKIHPDIKVKPVCFVLRLLRDPDILFLSQTELCIPVIYGHNDSCFALCKNMILKLRTGIPLCDLIDNPAEDLHLPRSSEKNTDSALDAVKDIANTLKNQMQSACLINVEKKHEAIISANSDFLDIIDSALNDARYIPHPEDEESFQRAFGSWGRAKDNRRLAGHRKEISNGEGIIKSRFFEYAGNHIINGIPDEFVSSVAELGFERAFIEDTIEPLLEKSLTAFESTYLSYSRNGIKDATAFEKATCEIFRTRLLFNAEHTGQKGRSSGRGGYADGFLKALDDCHCSIIDTKAYPYYSISADEHLRMTSNYIPNYHELCPGRQLQLEFCTYISGGFSAGFSSQLRIIETAAGIPASGITAKTLLEIADRRISPSSQPAYREAFRKVKILEKTDFEF